MSDTSDDKYTLFAQTVIVPRNMMKELTSSRVSIFFRMSALKKIEVPELRGSLKHPKAQETLKQSITDLAGLVDWFNTTNIDNVPADMVNTRQVKSMRPDTQLPSPLNTADFVSPDLALNFQQMLRTGESGLQDGTFTFHRKIMSHEHKIVAATLDGYALFMNLLWNGDRELIYTLTNMLCEIAAENKHMFQRTYVVAKTIGWYDHSYGYDSRFLDRHHLISKV